MVASVERAKKRNLQAAHALTVDEAGMTLDLLPFSSFPIESPVYHKNLTILFPGIMGGHVIEIALKGVVEPGDLIPFARYLLGSNPVTGSRPSGTPVQLLSNKVARNPIVTAIFFISLTSSPSPEGGEI